MALELFPGNIFVSLILLFNFFGKKERVSFVVISDVSLEYFVIYYYCVGLDRVSCFFSDDLCRRASTYELYVH